jgi:hypothetical protein
MFESCRAHLAFLGGASPALRSRALRSLRGLKDGRPVVLETNGRVSFIAK